MTKVKTLSNFKWHIGIFILRLFIGFRLIYGVIDNIISWDKMVEFSKFLEFHHFPLPIISAIFSVVIQFVCGLLLIIGFKSRLASTLLIINFILAIVFVHIFNNDPIEEMTPALAMFFISITLFLTGVGKISLDSYLKKP